MNEEIVQQIFAELFTSLEPLETQITGLLQFLKSKGIVTGEELAPFLEQAGNASNIRWRAARVRAAALIASALKPADEHGQTATAKTDQSTVGTASENAPVLSGKTASTTNTGSVSNGQDQEAQKFEDKAEAKKAEAKKPENVRKSEGSQKKDTSKKPGESAPEATHSEDDLRNSRLSNPPLLKTGKDNNKDKSKSRDKDKDKDKEAQTAGSASSGRSPSEAEWKPKAA